MRNSNCMKCLLSQHSRMVCLWGQGSQRALMLVGGATPYTDGFNSRPFSGEAGDLLDHILFKLGQNRENLYMTNLLKCSAKKDELPKGKKAQDELIQACWPYLQEEINFVRPKVIVPMGSLAVQAIAGITFISRADGYPIQQDDRWIVPCHHPSAALQSPSLEKNIAMALAKAFELAGMEVKPEGLGRIFQYKEVGKLE